MWVRISNFFLDGLNVHLRVFAVSFVIRPCTGNIKCIHYSGLWYFFYKVMLIKKGLTTKLRTSSFLWVSLMDVLLSLAHTFEARKLSLKNCNTSSRMFCARGCPDNVPSKFTRLWNQFHFSLWLLDIISTVVTQFLSPAIGNDSNCSDFFTRTNGGKMEKTSRQTQ